MKIGSSPTQREAFLQLLNLYWEVHPGMRFSDLFYSLFDSLNGEDEALLGRLAQWRDEVFATRTMNEADRCEQIGCEGVLNIMTSPDEDAAERRRFALLRAAASIHDITGNAPQSVSIAEQILAEIEARETKTKS